MPHARYRGPPMDLANMRAQGVRSLVCDLCHHDVVVKVDADAETFRCSPRIVCICVGIIGAFEQPNWQERQRKRV